VVGARGCHAYPCLWRKRTGGPGPSIVTRFGYRGRRLSLRFTPSWEDRESEPAKKTQLPQLSPVEVSFSHGFPRTSWFSF